MSFSLAEQTLVFLEAILLGIVGGLVYDMCRAVRMGARFNIFGICIMDAVFSFFIICTLFYFAVTEAASQMRFYVAFGHIGGMIIYFLTFSQIFRMVFGFFFDSLFGILHFIFEKFTKVIKIIMCYVFKKERYIDLKKKIKKKLSFFLKLR